MIGRFYSVLITFIIGLGVLGLAIIGNNLSYEDATISNTPVPAQIAPAAQKIKIRYSYYWPPLGGTNCAVYTEEWCRSRMASGKKWEHWIGRAVACPSEYPFGTIFIVDDQEWVCLDRGGKIVTSGGIPWIDFLTLVPRHSYGEVLEVEIIYP